MPPAKLGLVYSHTGLRKFIDAIGAAAHARAVLPRAQHRRRSAPSAGAWSTRSSPADELAGRALELAAEIAAQRPALAARQQARDRRAAAPPRARWTREIERELVELREACFRSEDFYEGVDAFAEKREPQLAGTRRAWPDSSSPPR